MKFGLLDFNMTVRDYWARSWNNKALLNIGDAVEYKVIEQLYSSLGIGDNEIIRISIPDLISYRGEALIVALNIALDSYVGYNDMLGKLSPDIIPVFLGMSFTDTNLTAPQIECLKRYAPVGCRDERSYICMKKLGVPCYLNGCTATVFKLERTASAEYDDKIVLVDVPYGVLESIPQEIRKDIVFLNQEMYCKEDEMPNGMVPDEWASRVLRCYSSHPRMIVTSRFHGAVLAMANDIPAVITLEKYTFRFSWLKNYCKIYTPECYKKIEWISKPVDFSTVRSKITEVAQKRIRDTVDAYRSLLELTDMQRSKDSEQENDSTNQVLYYRRVWDEIKETWDKSKSYLYAFWGVNDNAEKLYELISEEYPKAKLIDVYDMYKLVSFKGIDSKHPRELAKHNNQENFYVISTAYLASRIVPDICNECGFPQERSFLCQRDFIVSEDLKNKEKISGGG